MVRRLLFTAAVVGSFIGLWWAAATLAGSSLLPAPDKVFLALVGILKSPNGWMHIGITTYRVVLGTLIGSVVGTFFGVMTRYNRLAEAAVRSVIHPVLQSVPSICWALVFVLWFGLSNVTPVLTVAVAIAPFFIINIWEGMKELDLNLVEMAGMYTHRRSLVLGKVIAPMLYPYAFAATKSSFMTAWKIIIPAEIFGAISGMGYMLSLAFETYRIPQVFGWTLAFAFILLAFDRGIFDYIDRRYVRKWKPAELKSSG
jgi:ABC-type nitrate/sulfonate/bicarbonate transport system permease component